MLGKSCNGTDCTDLILIMTGPPGQCTHRDELTPPLNQLFFSLLPNVVLLQSYLIINATDFLPTDQQASNNPNVAAAAASASGGRARALFDFASDCEEELSLKVHWQFQILCIFIFRL